MRGANPHPPDLVRDDMQPITYRTRPVAIASAERFWLTDDLSALPTGDPLKTWACFMCLYARDVLTGVLPGPYTDADAELFARAALIPDTAFQRLKGLPDEQLAVHFNVPLEQIADQRHDTTQDKELT